MSRSYKKIAVVKDGGHDRKKDSSRRYRRVVTQMMVKVTKDYITYVNDNKPNLITDRREVTNTYYVCDWKYIPEWVGRKADISYYKRK